MASTSHYDWMGRYRVKETGSIFSHGEAETNSPHVPVVVVRERRLKKSILRTVGRLGSGLIDPVPYDTAWVARVPSKEDLSRPAFPDSLKWLLDHQEADGSWGRTLPVSPQSSTINTLAAIIALRQWNCREHEYRIRRGVAALRELADQLRGEKPSSVIGFSRALVHLQESARALYLDIPHESYASFAQEGREPLEFFRDLYKRNGYSQCLLWWQMVELLGDNADLGANDRDMKFAPTMLLANGSSGACPASTAYLLRSERLKGRDIIKANHYLNELYKAHKGGIPHIHDIDIFELAFSIDFFLKAGFSAKDPLFANSIKLLASRCYPRDKISFCSGTKEVHADTMAVALYVLHQAGYEVSVRHLFKFFKEDRFMHAATEDERTSVGLNVKALQYLRLFQGRPGVIDVMEKVANFLENAASPETCVLVEDEYHRSPFYSTSRAVFSLHGFRDNFVRKIVEFLVKAQNNDGGWGGDGISTAEESAYVILALCFARKKGHNFPDAVLSSASEFLFCIEKSRTYAELWAGKVLYRPTLVADSAILAAMFALTKAVEQATFPTILRESKPYYATIWYNTWDRVVYGAVILSFSSEFDTTPYSAQKDRVMKQSVERLVELKLVEAGYAGTISFDPLIHCTRGAVSDDILRLYSYFGNATRICDDILFGDNRPKHKTDVSTIKQVFQTFSEILSGKAKHIKELTPLKFPKFTEFCAVYLDVRRELMRRPNEMQAVLVEINKLFVENVANLTRRSPQSSEEYLDVRHERSTALGLLCSISNMSKGLNVSSFENCKDFLDIKYYGSKAACLAEDIFRTCDDLDKNCDNYVMLKREELKCATMTEALRASADVYNRLIVKMLSAKKRLENDPDYKDNADLFKAIYTVECLVDGIRDTSAKKVVKDGCVRSAGTRKQLTEVAVRRIMSDEKPANIMYLAN